MKFVIAILTTFIFSICFSTTQTDIVDEGDGGVICECNNNNKCVASGGGGKCSKTANCWKNDNKCQ